MSKRKDVIRQYDRVKIINPQVFLRCGYPLTKQIIKDTVITDEQKDLIKEMFKIFGVHSYQLSDIFMNLDVNHSRYYEKVLDVMAEVVLGPKQGGGPDRSIYTENRPDLLNISGQVISKKIVKTGRYTSGHSSCNYYGGYDDYDPPYLENETSHVILKVCVGNPSFIFGEEIEIEKCNVEKIVESRLQEAI